jgi:hypothetical protein
MCDGSTRDSDQKKVSCTACMSEGPKLPLPSSGLGIMESSDSWFGSSLDTVERRQAGILLASACLFPGKRGANPVGLAQSTPLAATHWPRPWNGACFMQTGTCANHPPRDRTAPCRAPLSKSTSIAGAGRKLEGTKLSTWPCTCTTAKVVPCQPSGQLIISLATLNLNTADCWVSQCRHTLDSTCPRRPNTQKTRLPTQWTRTRRTRGTRPTTRTRRT